MSHLRPLLTFCVVGGINTLAYYLTYLALRTVVPYLWAHAVGWCVGIVVSYVLNSRFTYRVPMSWRSFVMFPLSNVPNIVLSTVGVLVMVELWHWDERVAPLVATVLAIPISYTLARVILTRGGAGEDTPSAPAAP